MKTLFGKLPSGENVYKYVIKSDILTVSVLDFGGRLQSIQKNGADMICGFDTIEDYLADTSYQGALVGRYANRIARGRFSLNGKEYTLAVNDGPNHLHGGKIGYSHRIWRVEEEADDHLCLSLFSPDGEEGYPGNLFVQVTYTVEGATRRIDYRARADADTVVNLTNHAYFNLGGVEGGDILTHKITLHADRVTLVDDTLIPNGQRPDVTGTCFDLRRPREIGAFRTDPTAPAGFTGYDHNFILNHDETEEVMGYRLAHFATVTNRGHRLDAYTDQSGVQLYIGIGLGGKPDWYGGIPRIPYHGFCLETQLEPDSPNHGGAVLRAGDTYRHVTAFRFGDAK